MQGRKCSVDTSCSTYLDNYGLPTVIALVHSPFSERGALAIVQAPMSFFPAPLSGYLSGKLNFPALSGLLPLSSSELAGVGRHLQRQCPLAGGSTPPRYNALSPMSGLGAAGWRQPCTFAHAQSSPADWWSALGFLKCLLPQTLSCELIADSLGGGRRTSRRSWLC